MSHAKKRGRLEIIYCILKSLPDLKSHVLQKSNLSCKAMYSYLDWLEQRGMIMHDEYNMYHITMKGGDILLKLRVLFSDLQMEVRVFE